MKFRALVYMTAMSLFLMFFFLGLSLSPGMTPPSENSITFGLFKGTLLVSDTTREALEKSLLEIQKALDISIIEVKKTYTVVKQTAEDLTDSEKDREELIKKIPGESSSPQYEIPYELEQGGLVSVKIFDSQNNQISLLESYREKGGEFTEQWSGTDINGSLVAAGTYTYKVELNPDQAALLHYNQESIKDYLQFKEQMAYLAEQTHLKGVTLTFDIPLIEFYDKVFPVIKTHNLKATVYAPANYQAEAVEALVIEEYLRLGSRGDKVSQLQQKLNILGYQLLIDGIFGLRSRSQVAHFQKAYDLLIDGIVGPQTSGQINKLMDQIKELQNSEQVVIETDNTSPQGKTVPGSASMDSFKALLRQVDSREISRGEITI